MNQPLVGAVDVHSRTAKVEVGVMVQFVLKMVQEANEQHETEDDSGGVQESFEV